MSVSNSLQKQEKQEKPKLNIYLNKENVIASLNSALGSEVARKKFVADILSVASVNPELQNCDYASIVSGAMLANSLKLSLSPSIGHCFLVPFNDKKSGDKKAVFVLGYKGYIQLAMRSGFYKKINAFAIKEGELLEYDPFDENIVLKYIQDENEREQKKTVGYYAFFEYTNGFKKILYWTKEKMLIHADKYAPAFNLKSYELIQQNKIPQNEMWKYSSFWYKNFDEMALKTMLRQLISKWGLMSIEMIQAFESDVDYQEEKKNNNNFTPEDFFDTTENQSGQDSKSKIDTEIQEGQISFT